jgi:UDP-glucose 4-epimerase
VNVDPTEQILRRLEARPRPLFLASTSEVYGKNPKSPLSEDDDLSSVRRPGPVDLRRCTRRWTIPCPRGAPADGLPVVIGRFFNVVGPRQIGRYGMVLPRFVDQALSGGPLVVYDDGQQVRCFGHVADVIRGVLALMDCPEAQGRVFNLGSDRPVTVRDLAETVVRLVNPEIAIEHIPYEHAYAPGFEDIRNRVPDLTRVRQTVGYETRHASTIS